MATSSQTKFDMISSAVRSALGRHGKESVTVEVNTVLMSAQCLVLWVQVCVCV